LQARAAQLEHDRLEQCIQGLLAYEGDLVIRLPTLAELYPSSGGENPTGETPAAQEGQKGSLSSDLNPTPPAAAQEYNPGNSAEPMDICVEENMDEDFLYFCTVLAQPAGKEAACGIPSDVLPAGNPKVASPKINEDLVPATAQASVQRSLTADLLMGDQVTPTPHPPTHPPQPVLRS